MSVNFNPGSDFESLADGLEAVTLIQPNGTPIEVTDALRTAVSVGEAAASNGLILATDVVWHLPVAEVAEMPEVGAIIVPAVGDSWTVVVVSKYAQDTRWRCIARSQAALIAEADFVRFELLDDLVPGAIAIARGLTWQDETYVPSGIDIAIVNSSGDWFSKSGSHGWAIRQSDRPSVLIDGTTYAIYEIVWIEQAADEIEGTLRAALTTSDAQKQIDVRAFAGGPSPGSRITVENIALAGSESSFLFEGEANAVVRARRFGGQYRLTWVQCPSISPVQQPSVSLGTQGMIDDGVEAVFEIPFAAL